MRANKEFDAVIKDMSLRYMIPEEVLLKVWKSQFELARKVIEEVDYNDINTYKVVYFRKLGKFAPNKERMYMINKKKNEKR